MMKLAVSTILISFVVLSTSQDCNPSEVEWFPHPDSCTKFILCFHGNPLGEWELAGDNRKRPVSNLFNFRAILRSGTAF